MENVSLIGDRYRMPLLQLPKNVDDIYYIDGVIKTGKPPINNLPEGVTLSYQTKNGREGKANFRFTVSKVYADGDYFGKIWEAYEDIYENSNENAKLLRTKRQTVGHFYSNRLYKENAIIKRGEVIASASREENGFGDVKYKDIHGNESIKRYSFYERIPLEVQAKRRFDNNGILKGYLQKLAILLANDKNGCEIKYIRKLFGLLFR